MLKKIIILGLMALGFSSMASADVSTPLWACGLDSTTLTGWNGAIGLAISDIHGQGMVRCRSLIGPDEVDTPVTVSLMGVGAGLGFSRVDELDVRVAAIGVATPNDLFGTFKFQGAVSAQIFRRGADANVFGALSDRGLSVGVGVSGYRGVGLDATAEVQGFTIRAMPAD